MINESVEEVESPKAVAGITCDTFTDLVEWMRWAHERNRPFHASTFEGELGFRVDIVLDYSETVENNRIIRRLAE